MKAKRKMPLILEVKEVFTVNVKSPKQETSNKPSVGKKPTLQELEDLFRSEVNPLSVSHNKTQSNK